MGPLETWRLPTKCPLFGEISVLIAATMAREMIGPMPRDAHRQLASGRRPLLCVLAIVAFALIWILFRG